MTMTPLDFDLKHLWHPYTNVMAPDRTFLVKEAEGVWITLDDGTRLIDAMSSWWCMIHGHKHPRITKAVHDQLDRLPHVMFGGLTHDPAVELGQKLLEMTPSDLTRIFYCDSGSVSVEVAMKMAVQYQFSIGKPNKAKFATVRFGYHGDTWKAMSVCDPVTGMHHVFEGALTAQFFADQPTIKFGDEWIDDPEKNGLASIRKVFEEHHEEIAAFVIEPVVQGTGRMFYYHPEYLNQVRAICDEYGALLIFDEIATGFGRTGKLFATEFCTIQPDVLCMGKSLTGGTLSFATTMASEKVAEAIGAAEPGRFMHGPTYMANPLACAAANASLSLLQEGTWETQVSSIAAQMEEELAPARDLPNVKEVRIMGAIGVIEMAYNVSANEAHGYAKETGVFLRPFNRNVYTMPPFVISPDELSQVTSAMLKFAKVCSPI